MNDFSLIEKIDIIFKLISSSTVFFIFSIIGVVALLFFIICIIKNKKVNKWIIMSFIAFISALLLINYGKVIITVLDVMIDELFMALYFPKLPIYGFVLVINNLVFIMSIFNKNTPKQKKIINMISAILLNFFLILIIDVVSKNNINIHDEINLYTDSNLLVLLELSMGIFISWILANLIISAHLKLKKYDKTVTPPEIIFDWS